jgi:cyclohexadienyl dehydratase
MRWSVPSVVLALVLALATACDGRGERTAANESSTATSTQEALGPEHLRRVGTVRVCSTGDYQPFSHLDAQGQWSGVDIEMAQDLAKRLGVKLELVQTAWGTFMTDLGTKCDVAMGGISINASRAAHALFTSPLLRDGKAAIVRCTDGSKYTTLTDIDRPGVRVVVNPGGGNADFDSAHLHHAIVVTYPDNNTIFGQVVSGAADVMITDTSEIRFQIKRHPELCGVSLDHPFNLEQKAYVVPQSNSSLQQWMNQWLDVTRNDGTYAAISRKYVGVVMTP